MQMRRNLPVLEREHELDQARDPGGRLQMADIGLHRTDHHRAIGCAPFPEYRSECLDLDRIAKRRPGAVRFDVVNLFGLEAALVQRLADHGFLRRPVGRRQPAARTILVDGRTADHGKDAIAVRDGVRQTLEDDDAAALAIDEAVCAVVECLAPAVERHHPRPRVRDVVLWRQHEADAPRQSQSALACPQALRRQVHGDERRGTGGVDRHARPLQPEHVRQPSRRDAVRQTRHRVRVDARQLPFRLEIAVVGCAQPEEHAAAALVQLVGRLAGMLERFPADFEQQSLLRIHLDRFARRDAEEFRLELVNLREAPRPSGVHLSGRVRIGVVVGVDVPSVARNLCDRVHSVPQKLPIRLRRIRSAGKPAADSHDGDWLARGPILRLELRLHFLERDQRALQRRQRSKTIRLIRVRHPYSFPSFSSSSASASASLRCSIRAAAAEKSMSSGTAADTGGLLNPRTSRSR